MKVEPLKKEIYNKAKELGIDKITLKFSGGSDEGYLDIEMEPEWNQDFEGEVKDWAWEVYSYSGAGDGSDYGDDIDYDIKNGKVSTSEWFSSRQYDEGDEGSLEVSED